ncbi:TPA: exodeoxyribonuclease VII large subunit [Pseudomonas aeruginosa]|uniref:exodeoxyribonuclease VII large subunit n=1 Tax=Pseudomonas aeruginosa TaxID=287 RepID=UPI00053F0713|nr:exodeoxyribonuclease VII large subunit [Pseudomonas aeruginosa]MBG4396794.1 hypothetical protein [Pseudomonas aeruginosa]HBN9879241.1 hypothetical protein [Pseudomonas aeruginosa]HBN9880040.1 hypothetical protein [Pseudomonas aeruginosa]HBO1241447.1 hypothetical protein [Pseudomonas aeruginosa]HBO1880709.1 hypothetical protein [Pseudomonas aeruginosa]
MNTTNESQALLPPTIDLVLTPDALIGALSISAPSSPVTVRGIATEVKPWSKSGDSKVIKVYGRLVLGDASIRFELQPYAAIQDDAAVVLHGTLRIKKVDAFRTTHEVILVGDIVGTWLPQEAVPAAPPVSLIRQQPRISLEAAIAQHGLEAVAILATGTAWNDLTTAANPLPVFEHCRRVETNFMKPEQFLKDLAEVCREPAIQVLVIARGGGAGLEVIGDSPEVAAALLASRRPFYTALGHDDNVMLLDKHADRAFSTPSILGQMLVEAVRSILERQNLEERLSQSTLENASLKEQLHQANEKLAQERSQAREPSAPYDTARRTSSAAPLPTPEPVVNLRRYAIWGLLFLVAFAIGRCSM